jgi:hypothetical protein
LLTCVATKPVMQFFGNVLDLDVGHRKMIACYRHAQQDARFLVMD